MEEKTKFELKTFIESIMPGVWINEESLPNTDIQHVAYTFKELRPKNNLFIAMTKETFLQGSRNTGVYAACNDTHLLSPEQVEKISLLIVEKEIPDIATPQYQVSNSYDFLMSLAKVNRGNYTGKIISVTGTVGKTMTCELLKMALANQGNLLAAQGNFNSRTAIRAMLASLLPTTNYDYAVLETAMSSLWFGNGGVSAETRSNYSILTQFGRGQKETSVKDAIRHKTNITKNMAPNAKVILNHDIEEFATALATIQENTSAIYTYSQTNQDAFTVVEYIEYQREIALLQIRVDHQFATFELRQVDAMDKGFLSNLLAVITLLYLEGVDLENFYSQFLGFQGRPHLLEERPLTFNRRSIMLIDDTYNAEELSIKNAIEFVNHLTPKYSGKKIAIIGKIISIGKLKEEVYRNLAKVFSKSQFDLVVTVDDEVEILQNYLPSQIRGGHYTDLSLLKKKLKNCITDQSLILLKGSTRTTRIRQIIPLLEEPAIVSSYGVINSQGESHFSNENQLVSYGLSNLLIIHEVLYRLAENLIHLDDLVIFQKKMLNLGSIRSTRAKEGETRYLKDVLSQAVSLNAPDALLALAGFIFGDTRQALVSLKDKAEFYGISPKSVLNLTGRSNRSQGDTQKVALRDIAKAAQLFLNIPRDYLELLVNRNWMIGDKVFTRGNPYDNRLSNTASIVWGAKKELALVIKFSKNPPTIAIGINNEDGLEHLQTLEYLAAYGEMPTFPIREISLESSEINILGDVYFGEWYSEKRKKRGRSDALQMLGYHHSFEKIGRMFTKDAFNIVNYEGVFPKNSQQQSPLTGIKSFILGGESLPTIHELKARHIDMVTLATNHSFDYGRKSLEYTVTTFEQQQITTMGAGINQREAQRIIQFDYQGKQYALFNAYWYRVENERLYNPYAIGEQAGVACGNQVLRQGIEIYKKNHPGNKVILIIHWGVDFRGIHGLQEKIANEMIEAGADLIIGHGPHCVQPIKDYQGKKVVFSVGNGVFNSDGEFNQRGIPPFGLITRLDLASEEVRLYPIYVNNLQTYWQPHLITKNQLSEFYSLDLGVFNQQALQIDETGSYYFSFSM